jgi:hypothetical protein
MSNSRKIKLSKSIPLGRISLLHREINSYHSKWNTKKVIEIVDLSIIEDFYTILQYLNRAISVAGASAYLTGEANENLTYKKTGGTIAVASLYVDFLASYGKEKLFKPEERKKKWDKLINETESLQNSYQELVEIIEPICSDDSFGKLNEVIKALKAIGKELIKKDDNGNLKEFALLNDGPSEYSGIKQRIGRLFSSKRHLLKNWKKWGDEWEERRNKQKEVKFLIETLKRAISKYRQGIDENEVENEIEEKMKELWIVNSEDSGKVNRIENLNNSNCLPLLNSKTEEIKLEEISVAQIQIPPK